MTPANAKPADEPIFIVGAPRSGTTLLAALLASHSRISCGPEAQFFNKLDPAHIAAAVRDPYWPHSAISLLCSLTLANQRVIDLFGIDESYLTQFLSLRTPSAGAMLEALTKTLAERQGKARWAEKTPNHILHLTEIRREWPAATMVRIVRDPRDSASSMRRLPWASRSVLANAQLWADWHEQSKSFFRQDLHTWTVRFEDLVDEPVAYLRDLCEFIGEKYEPTMLDTSVSGGIVSSPTETWKSDVSKPIDPQQGSRWKEHLPDDLARGVSLICHRGIVEFDYEILARPVNSLDVYRLDRHALERHESAVLSLAAIGTRLRRSQLPLQEMEVAVFQRQAAAGLKAWSMSLLLMATRRMRGLETTYINSHKGLRAAVGRFAARGLFGARVLRPKAPDK